MLLTSINCIVLYKGYITYHKILMVGLYTLLFDTVPWDQATGMVPNKGYTRSPDPSY